MLEDPTPAKAETEVRVRSNTSEATFEKWEIVMGKPPGKLNKMDAGCRVVRREKPRWERSLVGRRRGRQGDGAK